MTNVLIIICHLVEIGGLFDLPKSGGGHVPPPHCFHMEVKVAVLNAISQNYNFFEVKLVPYASLCPGNYLDQFFVKF